MNDYKCEKCLHRVPYFENGSWTALCESWDCEFMSREEAKKALEEKMASMRGEQE